MIGIREWRASAGSHEGGRERPRRPGWVRGHGRAIEGYVWGIGTTVTSTVLAHVGVRYLQLADLIMIYLVGVVFISTTRFGIGSSVFTAVTSVLCFDYFFVPPVLQWALPDLQNGITFAVMLAVAGVISGLTARLRRQEASARKGEARTAALYSMSRELALVRNTDQLLSVATQHVEGIFGVRAVILLAELDGELVIPGAPHPMHLTPSEAALARHAWSRREVVAAESPDDRGVYLTLLGSHAPLGVLGLPQGSLHQIRKNDQIELLETCSHQIATAIERALRVKDVQRAQLVVETERLRSSLLSAVSHDLKTPLTAILSAGTTLAENEASLDRGTRSDLLATVVQEAERLNGLVVNLLAMTRLESRTIEIQKMDEAIEEVIGEALGRLSVRLSGRKVQTFVPAETPLLPMDPMLVGQVFVNLLENAIKYTPGGSPLDIRVSVESTWVKVAIVDRGPGVPVDEQEKVFEKFYRGRKVPKGDGGVGLGLTICRAIVEAHGGRMWIDNRPGGGCSVEFTLPKSLGELGANRSLPEIVAPDTMEISKHG